MNNLHNNGFSFIEKDWEGEKIRLKTEVTRMLKQEIINGDLKQGERLVEAEIAKKLGISRGTLRESIRELTSEGLVENIPRRGTYISTISTEEVRELFSLRIVLEGMAARLALEKVVDEDIQELELYMNRMLESAQNNNTKELLNNDYYFHQLIYLKSGNKFLIKFLSEIAIVYRLSLNEGVKWMKDIQYLAKTHLPILDVFKTKNIEKAEDVIRDHLSWIL